MANSPNKKIAIYLDGTWNTPESRTNVFSLFEETLGERAGPEILRPFVPLWQKPIHTITKYFSSSNKKRKWLAQQYTRLKTSQRIRYYDPGVGTRFLNRARGGAFGRGVSENILQAYEFLSHVWEEGDEIYIFGFSRGAYTARSLVGLLNIVGLMNSEDCLIKHKRKDVVNYLHYYIKYLHHQKQAQLDYQHSNISKPHKPAWMEKIPDSRKNVTVKFIGVWDTVGSLGIPNRFKTFFSRFTFNVYETLGNTEVCDNIEYAYHAMAIDEHRVDFQVTPWTYKAEHTEKPTLLKDIQQNWFVGAHGNVGGGYSDNYLNEASRYWIQKKAFDVGLEFHHLLKPRKEIFDEPIINSYDEFAGGLHKRFHPPIARKLSCHLPIKPGSIINERIDMSVWEYYQQNPNYRPQNIPSSAIAENIHNLLDDTP